MSTKFNKNKTNILVIIVTIILSIALVLCVIQQINYVIYQERKESLSQLVQTSATTITESLNSQWRIVDFCANDALTSIKTNDDVLNYLENFSYSTDYFFFVDSNGKYYCSDGHSGKIVDSEYYYSEIENVEYLGSLPHLGNESYLILRKHLSTPIIAKFNDSDVEINYMGCVHSLSQLSQTISDLYLGKNNTIIFDSNDGVMLYHEFNLGLLIEGYNVYHKYNDGDIRYSVKSQDVIENIKAGKTTVCLMDINNEDVFICTDKIGVSSWTLLMVVNASFFDSKIATSMSSVLIAMCLIVGIFGIAVISAYTINAKNKQRKFIIAEQEKVNTALQAAYKTKSDFLSYMSHDIRTPINGIIGMANIGINIDNNNEKAKECFRKIDVSGKHLLSLVNDVLDMSALESGKVAIRNDCFNLSNLLKDCLDIINGQLDNRVLTIADNFVINNHDVIGDELHLKQILINILGNAVKFTNDGGKINFNVKQLETHNGIATYQFIVEDNGIGMSQEILDHLFDAYVQGNSRSIYKGSGLGMAISYQFAKMMNGRIEVQSQEGQGSKFTLTIPFTINQDNNPDCINGLNILLVEDNDLNIEIAKELLKSKGANVKIAKNGLEALQVFQACEVNEIDCILMDMMMPKMDGIQATKAIRNLNRSDKDIPIIGASANTFKDDIDRMMAAGMNDCISKPINIELLVKIIAKVRLKYENSK